MLESKFELLKLLNENSLITQRMVAKKIGISLGKVNSLIKEFIELGYINKVILDKSIEYKLTKNGVKILEDNINKAKNLRLQMHENSKWEVKQAVILAAGSRSDFDIPIALLEIEDFKIIDRTISILKESDIEKIIIITGYKNEMFKYLEDKYKEVKIVINKDYKWTGTMSSIISAELVIDDDFILLESDLVFEKRAIKELINSEERDCILLTRESGSGDEAFVEIRDGYLFKMSKDIHQFNNIHGEVVGITKISYKLFQLMLKEFANNTNPYIHYEYTLLDVARNYNVGYIKIDDLIWGEIDNLEQYEKVKKSIMPKIRRKLLNNSKER